MVVSRNGIADKVKGTNNLDLVEIISGSGAEMYNLQVAGLITQDIEDTIRRYKDVALMASSWDDHSDNGYNDTYSRYYDYVDKHDNWNEHSYDDDCLFR